MTPETINTLSETTRFRVVEARVPFGGTQPKYAVLDTLRDEVVFETDSDREVEVFLYGAEAGERRAV